MSGHHVCPQSLHGHPTGGTHTPDRLRADPNDVGRSPPSGLTECLEANEQESHFLNLSTLVKETPLLVPRRLYRFARLPRAHRCVRGALEDQSHRASHRKTSPVSRNLRAAAGRGSPLFNRGRRADAIRRPGPGQNLVCPNRRRGSPMEPTRQENIGTRHSAARALLPLSHSSWQQLF